MPLRAPMTQAYGSELCVTSAGFGPEVLLVHGGASAQTTWRGLEPMQAHWTMGYAHRRGFAPSPPGRHDFEVDADDIEGLLLERRPHLVAHCYGALGALIAAARCPERVRSLTLIEPPLHRLLPDDPEVAHLDQLGSAIWRDGPEADPAILREFLPLAGVEGVHDGPLPEAAVRGLRRAHGGRPPSQCEPPLEPIRRAKIPVLVASGGHLSPIERICDVLAQELEAIRVVSPGAGHFVPAAPGFASRLSAFLSSHEAEQARSSHDHKPGHDR